MKQNRAWVRALSFFLVVTFSAQEVGLAAVDFTAKAEVAPKNFSVPQNIGVVKDAAALKNSEVIININAC